MQSKTKRQYVRNIDGLIDACFDQLEDLRDGISNANETIAFAKTAEMIVRGVEMNLKQQALQYAHEQRILELKNRQLELTYAKPEISSDAETRDQDGSYSDGGSEVQGEYDEGSDEYQLHSQLCMHN